MSFLQLAQDMISDMVSWRRYIHQNAELSFEEFGTQDFIEGVLDMYAIDHERVAGTGVLAKLNVGCGTGVAVLRADMDALEIFEESGTEFACVSGNMHACGHDMHTVALLGAMVLLKNSDVQREVWGLFQPGEELHPGGASIVLEEGVFEGVNVDWFLAQHCSPEIECGTVGVCGGQFMASTDEIHINVIGEGGHGAMPHLCKDAVLASSAIVVAMQQINARNNWALNPSVISFGNMVADGATNVLPDRVLIEGTFRTMDERWRAVAKERIVEVAQSTAQAYLCDAEVEIKDGYPSVFNNENMIENLKNCIESDIKVIKIDRRMTAEDFGFFSQLYPSLMVRLGVGHSDSQNFALHTSRFNPNENALAIGAALLASYAYYN